MTEEELEKAAEVLRWLSDKLSDRGAHEEALNVTCVASICDHWVTILNAVEHEEIRHGGYQDTPESDTYWEDTKLPYLISKDD
jgi:hypothetical protein